MTELLKELKPEKYVHYSKHEANNNAAVITSLGTMWVISEGNQQNVIKFTV